VGNLVSAIATHTPPHRQGSVKRVKMSRGEGPLRQIGCCTIAAFAAG
jgi:hypothetical protein